VEFERLVSTLNTLTRDLEATLKQGPLFCEVIFDGWPLE